MTGTRLSRPALAIGVLFTFVPMLPAFASSTQLGLAARAGIAAAWVIGVSVIDTLGRRGSRLGVIAAACLSFSAGGWVVIDSGKPHSFYWSLFILPIFAQARGVPPSRRLWLATTLAPLTICAVFVARGRSLSALAAPLSLAALFPMLYLSLSRHAARLGQLAREREARETAALGVRDEQLRLHVTREASSGAASDIEAAAALAALAASALEAGDAEGPSLLAQARAAIRDAATSVRESVWGLDPDAARWDAIEPNLRRMVGDLGPPGSTVSFSVESESLIASEERVGLVRRLRASLKTAEGPVKVGIAQADGQLELVVAPAGGGP
ncbi:MAG: hypothetical protein IT377_25640 [Polyangiaceae bacterium]|nr:hypothetical protein [Polyangiaceae bacterium]